MNSGPFSRHKNTRALYLQRQFTNIKLDNFPNVTAYYQELKSISDQLGNVGDKVSDPRMVLQLITGLNANFDTIGTQLSYITPLPSIYQARSMLLLEESRKQKQILPPSTPTDVALVTTATDSSLPRPSSTANYQYHDSNRGRGGNR
ncbi:uncharacterized protein [Rutidosis leptorrhynchoides]|uniref:uncharacterized protein n=1 Tax=Rutidosis leptorrhynchoides TaxID=125765 RepID=UPI003A991BD9